MSGWCLKLFVRAASSSQNTTDAAYSRGIAENADAGAEVFKIKMVLRSAMNGHGVLFSEKRRVPRAFPMVTGAESADTVAAASFGAAPRDQIRSPHVPCLQESELKNLTSIRFLQAASSHGNEMDVADIFGLVWRFVRTACRRSNSIYYSSSRAACV